MAPDFNLPNSFPICWVAEPVINLAVQLIKVEEVVRTQSIRALLFGHSGENLETRSLPRSRAENRSVESNAKRHRFPHSAPNFRFLREGDAHGRGETDLFTRTYGGVRERNIF